MTEDKKTINVSRYSSRRLYNTGTSEYVTVKELAELIRKGHDIKVTDKKSGQDITAQILLQIIAEQEAEEGSVLPTNVLTDIVRYYSSDAKNLVPDFLSESFQMLKEHRRNIAGSLREQITNPLDPQKAINSFDAWRAAQQDILNSIVSAWLPKPAEPLETKGIVEPVREEIPDAGKAESKSELAEELAQLKRQIDQIQSKLEDIE